MKKLFAFLMAVVMLLSLSACGGGTGGSKEGSVPGTAYIDDCYVEVTDCVGQLSTLYAGQFIALVKVKFTNNSDAATSLFFTASIKAFQNGVELSPAAWVPADHGITQKDSDNIQPGYSLSTGYAYVLKSTTDPVLVQIYDGLDLISEKEFSI